MVGLHWSAPGTWKLPTQLPLEQALPLGVFVVGVLHELPLFVQLPALQICGCCIEQLTLVPEHSTQVPFKQALPQVAVLIHVPSGWQVWARSPLH